MKLINNELFITISELVGVGVSEKYLWKAKSIGVKCWDFIDDPQDKRKVLVRYETLKDQYKKLITERYGNPYDYVARQPILDLVKMDSTANTFYRKHQFGNNQYLTPKTVNKYTRAASWLNMLNIVDRVYIKKMLGLTMPDFYTHVGMLINDEKRNGQDKNYNDIYQLPGDFPASYQRLMARAERYKNGGYDDLIDPMYCNKMAAKVGKNDGGFDPELYRKQVAVIRKAAALHTNFDAAQVTEFANIIFSKNGWNELSTSTVYNIMQENKAILTPGRRGRKAYNNEVAMQHKRTPPKYPAYYWTLDGWTVELLYQDETGYNNRLVVVIVLDACGKYPVGYAIGERENAELIRQANRNAILHMKELFGSHYRPNQIQSDRYALKALTPFYQAMAHLHTPAAVGNSKSKIIEPYFKYLNKKYCQRKFNWSGFNVTAKKENQVNAEMLDMIKHSFPDKKSVIADIDRIIATERKNKIAVYAAAWETMPSEHKQVVDDIDWLMIFGRPHTETNRITGQGIIASLNGQKITYDSFDPSFRTQLTTDWLLMYENEDMSRVLAISPDMKERYLLHKKVSEAMDVLSTTEEHREYGQKIREYNKARIEEIINTYAEDAEIVDEIIEKTPLSLNDADEAALKLMFTTRGQQKEKLQDAKGLKKVQQKEQKALIAAQQQQQQSWTEQQQAWLQSKTDVNKYL